MYVDACAYVTLKHFCHVGLSVRGCYTACHCFVFYRSKCEEHPKWTSVTALSLQVIAFAEDPAGFKWELIERPQESAEPLCQVMLRVLDLDKSIEFYQRICGMQCLR